MPHPQPVILRVPHQEQAPTSQTRNARGVAAVTERIRTVFVSLVAAPTARLIPATTGFVL